MKAELTHPLTYYEKALRWIINQLAGNSRNKCFPRWKIVENNAKWKFNKFCGWNVKKKTSAVKNISCELKRPADGNTWRSQMALLHPTDGDRYCQQMAIQRTVKFKMQATDGIPLNNLIVKNIFHKKEKIEKKCFLCTVIQPQTTRLTKSADNLKNLFCKNVNDGKYLRKHQNQQWVNVENKSHRLAYKHTPAVILFRKSTPTDIFFMSTNIRFTSTDILCTSAVACGNKRPTDGDTWCR